MRLHVSTITWSSSGRLNTRKPKFKLQMLFYDLRLYLNLNPQPMLAFWFLCIYTALGLPRIGSNM